MYILVNNHPFNIFESEISDIYEIDDGFAQRFITDWPRSSRHMELNVAETENFISYMGFFDKEETYKDYSFFGVKKSSSEEEKVRYLPGFFFYIYTEKRVVVSKLFKTKEEAEECRNELLKTINKMASRLPKVDIK